MPRASVSRETAANPEFCRKRAQGIADVLREVLQPARAAGVAALFLHLLGAAQLEAGSPAGFGWRARRAR